MIDRSRPLRHQAGRLMEIQILLALILLGWAWLFTFSPVAAGTIAAVVGLLVLAAWIRHRVKLSGLEDETAHAAARVRDRSFPGADIVPGINAWNDSLPLAVIVHHDGSQLAFVWIAEGSERTCSVRFDQVARISLETEQYGPLGSVDKKTRHRIYFHCREDVPGCEGVMQNNKAGLEYVFHHAARSALARLGEGTRGKVPVGEAR